MTKRRHTTPWFGIGLGLYALALLTAIAVGLNLVTQKLANYENGLPTHAADAVFADYFADNADKALSEFAPETGEFETKDVYGGVVRDLIGDKGLRYFETGATGETHHYTVASGDTRIADFSLTPAEEKGLWRLDTIVFSVKPEQTVTVTAVKGSTVYVNGVALTDEFLSGEPQYDHFSNDHMRVNAESEPLAEGIATVTYQVDGLYAMPTVTVKDRRGRDCEVTEKNGVFTAGLLFDDDRLPEVEATVLKAAEEYSKHMHLTTSYGTLGQYFDKSCTFYKDLRKASIWDNLNIRTYKFVTEEVSELYFFTDDVFSAWVHLEEDVVPEKTGKHETYHIDCRLYFHRTENGWRVYDVSFTKTA